MKVAYSKKKSDVATKPTIFEPPTKLKKKLENRMYIYTCNYKEHCLQQKQKPLWWQFSRQNLSEQTKNQQYIFSEFFSISLIPKKTRCGHDSNPTPQGTKATANLQAKGEATWNMLSGGKKRSEDKRKEVIQLILLT